MKGLTEIMMESTEENTKASWPKIFRDEGRKRKRDPMVGFAYCLVAAGLVGSVWNLSEALAPASAIGIVAGAEGVVAMCGAQSVKAASAGERYRAARIGMWLVPVVAIVANWSAAAFASHVSWDTAFLYALAPLGTCVAAEYIAYVKRQEVQERDGITELRRAAAAEREKRKIQEDLNADAAQRENARQIKENELFYWMSRYEKKRWPFRAMAERQVWKLIRTAALDDSARTDRMQEEVDRFLSSWMRTTSDASSSSKWASISGERKESARQVGGSEEQKAMESGPSPMLRAVPKQGPTRTIVSVPVDSAEDRSKNLKRIAALWYIYEDELGEKGEGPNQAEFARRLEIKAPQVSRAKKRFGREDLRDVDYKNVEIEYRDKIAS